MALIGKTESFWVATTPATAYPSLKHDIEVDVAVIGGGIAGLMTAYFLGQSGKKVAVIEARRIATGTTGHTTAHLSIAHDIIYDRLIKNFGKEGAKSYAEANFEGIRLIGDIARKEGIGCDFAPTSEYVYAPKGKDEEIIEKEYEATRNLDLRTELLDKAPLPFITGKAIKYNGQAQFHPRKFLVALAEKFVNNGGQIFEQTRATGVKEGEPMEVETNRGRIRAKEVVVATLYPFLDRGLYFTRLDVFTSYVLAVTVEDEFPQEMYDSSEERSHYLRRQPYKGRFVVLVGGEGHRTGEISETDERYARLEEFARKSLRVKEVLYRWSTHDTYPVDGVPYIGKFLPTSEHLYVLTGFKGWGMAHGVVGGRIIGDLINKKPNKYVDLFNPGRVKIKAGAGKVAGLGVKVGKKYLEGRLERGVKADLETLERDEWKIIDNQGDKVAAFRDEEGAIHAVSAYCRHLGCTVKFNRAERTWDCPCHGSRYTLDGEVLYGPTVRGLKEK